MTQYWHGGDLASYVVTVGGDNAVVFAPGAVLKVWNARIGGSQITDLLDSSGQPITTLTASAGTDGWPVGGLPRYKAPSPTVWVGQDGQPRVMSISTDVADLAVRAIQDIANHAGQLNGHGTGLGDLVDVEVGTTVGRTPGHLVGWEDGQFRLLAPSQAAGAVLLTPPSPAGIYAGNAAQPPPSGQSTPWLRMRQPYAAGDSNADSIALSATHSDGTTPIKTFWINGNNEVRAAPSSPARLAAQVFESYETVGGASTGRFVEVSTNPSDPANREPLLGVFGTAHSTQPGWVVASRILAGQAGVRAGGSYNSLDPATQRGRRTSSGAPTSGTWTTGDTILDAAGAVWLCTAGGTPGSWVSATGAPMMPLIPLYMYPSFFGSGWDDLAVSPVRGGVVIANPANGPGASSNADWEREIGEARAAGWRVVGYVTCDETGLGGMDAGSRDTAAITADVDAWYTFYNIDGIFFDLIPTGVQAVPASYVDTICEHVHTKGVAQLAVVNPGTYPVTGDYVAAADVAIVWEGDFAAQDYLGFEIPEYASWVGDYPPTKYGHLVYGADEAQMRQAAEHALELGVGSFYAADTNSAWLTLASYWPQEIPVLEASRPALDLLDRRVHRGPLTATPLRVDGARDDPEEALAGLLAALTSLGLIRDETTST